MDRGWLLCDTAGVVGWFCSPSTGSPFGHHPRLRMVCHLWGQWMSMWRRFACLRPCISCIVCRHSHHLSSSAASTQRYSRLWRRRTASVEGETQMGRGGCCATPPVSESGFVYLPRVRPLGVTRGYAWCVPSGDSG